MVLYDNLVSKEILELIPAGTDKIYVGRKFGDQTDPNQRQSTINELLKKLAGENKKVIRLKSGDPNIFGRAAEESRFLLGEGFSIEVVPGISAALAASSTVNIPLTERHKSNAVVICTAHTANYNCDLFTCLANFLKAGNVLALYMGLKKLKELIPQLIGICEDKTIPISAIANVSRINEEVVSSTLEHIVEEIENQNLSMPVVFLIGTEPIKGKDRALERVSLQSISANIKSLFP